MNEVGPYFNQISTSIYYFSMRLHPNRPHWLERVRFRLHSKWSIANCSEAVTSISLNFPQYLVLRNNASSEKCFSSISVTNERQSISLPLFPNLEILLELLKYLLIVCNSRARRMGLIRGGAFNGQPYYPSILSSVHRETREKHAIATRRQTNVFAINRLSRVSVYLCLSFHTKCVDSEEPVRRLYSARIPR